MTQAADATPAGHDASAEAVGGPAGRTPEQARRKLESAVAYHERDLGLVDEAVQGTARRIGRIRAELAAAERAAEELDALKAATEAAVLDARAALASFDGGEG